MSNIISEKLFIPGVKYKAKPGLRSILKYIKLITLSFSILLTNCSKKNGDVKPGAQTPISKPIANFSFKITNNGILPCTVIFVDSSKFATTYKWDFGDGNSSNVENPSNIYASAKTYNVKLVIANSAGKDSITKQVTVILNPPIVNFGFKIVTAGSLPSTVNFTDSSKNANSYKWDFGDGATSIIQNSQHAYKSGGTYKVTLTATNAAGSNSIVKTLNIAPFLQAYTAFDKNNYNLYSWEGKYVTILMRTPGLDATTMFNWARTMDSCYSFYKTATGQEPVKYQGITYFDNRSTIADVATTCGAGCGYLGFTGIEMQNAYTDRMYNYVKQNLYDQELFYEFGRNFWFYSNQLQYKSNDPVVTGFAIFMRFMAMDATKVSPAPFNSTPWTVFRSSEEGLVDMYTANNAYSWANTMGLGQGIQNQLGLGASDLIASFLMRLTNNYGGSSFVNNIWKQAALRPAAVTTQDAVDNFILASCAAANKNLTTLFTVTWRWPMSDSAKAEAVKYPN
jgi:PKD repeat protein